MILNSFGAMLRSGDKVDSPENQETALVGSGDGASIEAASRRPRGRPRGSKNKPKPPVIVTREVDPPSAMRAHVLEIPAGHDVAACLALFSRRRGVGLCVLAGTGAVADVVLRASHADEGGASVGLRGRFQLLSISATFHPPSFAVAAAAGGMSVSLAGPRGQVVGGMLAGPLMAAGTVVVVAAAFVDPTFHRLPAEDEDGVSNSVSGGEAEAAEKAENEPHDHQQRRQQTVAETSSMSTMYKSRHLPPGTEVMWGGGPTARPPPPPPPY